MSIFLYQKTHNKTGLKYLGKTKRNPYTYVGSGKYWKLHLAKHGLDISTKILLESDNIEEIRQAGIRYSELWNIVESKEWANLVDENGQGLDNMPLAVRQKVSNSMKGRFKGRPAHNKGLKQTHKPHKADGNYNGSNGKLKGIKRPKVLCVCGKSVDVANLKRYHKDC